MSRNYLCLEAPQMTCVSWHIRVWLYIIIRCRCCNMTDTLAHCRNILVMCPSMSIRCNLLRHPVSENRKFRWQRQGWFDVMLAASPLTSCLPPAAVRCVTYGWQLPCLAPATVARTNRRDIIGANDCCELLLLWADNRIKIVAFRHFSLSRFYAGLQTRSV